MKDGDKKGYISLVYNPERTPKTDYPEKLSEYLINRFGLKKGSWLLEIGCGRGDFLNAFHHAGLNCYGIDREKASVELNPELDIRLCDISKENLPFDDNSFDVVYHKSVLEHIYDPGNLMKETKRIMKQGGKLIILTPDWHSQMKNFYEDFTHCRPYTKGAIIDLLSLYHFREADVEIFYQLPMIWRHPSMKALSIFLQFFLNVYSARWLTDKTGRKVFRWSVELMLLGYGVK